MSTARLTIDLDALAANYRVLAAQAGVEVAPVVKADAYGLGAGPVARRLWAEGARRFFVARANEGRALRRALGVQRPAEIYVLDGAAPGRAGLFSGGELRPVLNSPEQVAAWRAAGGGPCAVHIDTGMNRLGLRPEEAGLAADLAPAIVLSHLACTDEPANPMNRRQRDLFAEASRAFPGARLCLANSGGVFLGPDYAFDLVRPGVSLFGGGPEGRPDPRLRAVATFEADVLQVREAAAGESVGYGAAHGLVADTRIAVVGAGYADGVPRSSSPRGQVWLAGRRRPIVGRISMDSLAVDAGDAAVRAGDRVELFGPRLPLDEAAAAAGTIAYELLTSVGGRVERRYLGGAG